MSHGVKRATIPIVLILAAAASSAGDDFISAPDAKFTSVNQIGLTVNNNGFLGTNLPNAESDPSFEYPLGTDIERMIRGGIWIGAINADNDTLVSTATLDGSYTAPIVTEYIDGPLIVERSTLPNSRYFDENAISEQDFVCFFEDSDSNRVSEHHPLPVRVDLETYAWSFQPVDQMVILSYKITNIGNNRLENVYVGMYAELISCSKAFSDPFPGQCFSTKHLEFETERRLMANRYYDQSNSLLPGWGALQILGSSPDSIAGKTLTYNWWKWDPEEADRKRDADRYLDMSNGIVDPPVSDDGTASSTDPVSLISVGPYRFLDPDSSITVVMAAVGGKDWDDLLFRADWAIRTYESNYQIPLPPPSPGLYVDPGPNSVRLFWDAFPETIPDPVLEDSLDFQGYRIYMSRDNIDYVQVAEYDVEDTIGFNTGFDAVKIDTVIDGHIYNYTDEITSLKDGFEYFISVTSFDKGAKSQGVPSLESGISQNRKIAIPGSDPAPADGGGPAVTVFPNPYHGEAVWDGQYARERLIYFANLPPRCTIRIFTLAGDKVDEIEFDSREYDGSNAAAIFDTDFDPPELSGGMAAWDLLSERDQSIASGLYVFSVENHDTGDSQVGKFLVIR